MTEYDETGLSEVEIRSGNPRSQQFRLLTKNKSGKLLVLCGDCHNDEIYLRRMFKWNIAKLSEDGNGFVCRVNRHWDFYPAFYVEFSRKIGGHYVNPLKPLKFRAKLNPYKLTSYPSTYFTHGYEMEHKNGVAPWLRKAIELESHYMMLIKQELQKGYHIFRTPLSGINSDLKDLVITDEKFYIVAALDIVRSYKQKRAKAYWLLKTRRSLVVSKYNYFLCYAHANKARTAGDLRFLVPSMRLFNTRTKKYKFYILESHANFYAFGLSRLIELISN